MLDQPPLVVHVRAETRAEHTAQPLPLVKARRSSEVGETLLDVPFPGQGVMLPLLCAEARYIFRQSGALSVHQRPQVVIPPSRHIARSLSIGDVAAR